jgi:hypothetical protein
MANLTTITAEDSRQLRNGIRPHQETREEEEELILEDFGMEGHAHILRNLAVGESYELPAFLSEYGEQPLHNYVQRLREIGLNIGRGDAEYGFKMPMPEKGAGRRKLIIFRRHK